MRAAACTRLPRVAARHRTPQRQRQRVLLRLETHAHAHAAAMEDGTPIVEIEIEIPMAELVMAEEFALMMPEASAYHDRMLREHADPYQEDVRALIEVGNLVPATDYGNALRLCAQFKAAWTRMFDGIDAIVAPTVASPAVLRNQASVRWADGTEEAPACFFVRLSARGNVTGLPSVAEPCGFSSNRLPTSFQVIGRPFGEARIQRIACAYGRGSDGRRSGRRSEPRRRSRRRSLPTGEVSSERACRSLRAASYLQATAAVPPRRMQGHLAAFRSVATAPAGWLGDRRARGLRRP